VERGLLQQAWELYTASLLFIKPSTISEWRGMAKIMKKIGKQEDWKRYYLKRYMYIIDDYILVHLFVDINLVIMIGEDLVLLNPIITQL
jgi:hypothetical protein